MQEATAHTTEERQTLTVCSCAVCGRRAAVQHLGSMFFWAMAFAFLVAGTDAQPPACLQVDKSIGKMEYSGQSGCVELTCTSGCSLAKMAFKASSMDGMYVNYASNALNFDMKAFGMAP